MDNFGLYGSPLLYTAKKKIMQLIKNSLVNDHLDSTFTFVRPRFEPILLQYEHEALTTLRKKAGIEFWVSHVSRGT